jgi:protein-tyrosine phosphatase
MHIGQLRLPRRWDRPPPRRAEGAGRPPPRSPEPSSFYIRAGGLKSPGYRSRFAEIVFNWTACTHRLPWRGDSRGLQLNPENPGPISPHVVRFLELQGIRIAEPVRFPRQVLESDLQAAELVVAAKEAEHRPLLARHFGARDDRVEYWGVHDVEVWSPNEVLPILAAGVHDPVRRFMA